MVRWCVCFGKCVRCCATFFGGGGGGGRGG